MINKTDNKHLVDTFCSTEVSKKTALLVGVI